MGILYKVNSRNQPAVHRATKFLAGLFVGFLVALSGLSSAAAEPVRLHCGKAKSALVFINDMELGECAEDYDLPPGTYDLTLRFEDDSTWSTTLTVNEGRTANVFVQVPTATSAEPQPEDDDTPELSVSTSTSEQPAADALTVVDPEPLPVEPAFVEENEEEKSDISAAKQDDVGALAPALDEEPEVEEKLRASLEPAPHPKPVNEVVHQAPETSSTPQETRLEDLNWYVPGEEQRKLPWNSHDPWWIWGRSHNLGLVLGYQGAFSSPAETEEQALFDSMGLGGRRGASGEFGLRYNGFYVFLPPKPGVGISIPFNTSGVILKDFYVPDIQLGILYPHVQLRALWRGDHIQTDESLVGEVDVNYQSLLVNTQFSPLGFRATYEDFVVVDIFPYIGAWMDVSILSIDGDDPDIPEEHELFYMS